MAVFVIQTNEFLRDGSRRYVYFETPHATLDALAAELRGGPVAGRQLKASLENGVYLIREATPLMLTTAAINRAYEPEYPFVAGAA